MVTTQGITWTILTDISNNNQKVETIIIEGTDVDNIFPIGDYLNLTPGRYNYQLWTKQGNGQVIEQNPSSFDWFPTVELAHQPTLADGTTSNVFPSVTLITPDAAKNDVNAFKLALEVGNNIAYIDKSFTQAGNVLRYEATTGNWVSVTEVSATGNLFDLTKPLVLITDWQADSGALQYNSGTAEAVADSVFASLVKLDDQLGGAFSTTPRIYDKQGDLIYTPGNLFNSPFHFIGFGSGGVVNSEIIQRIGTAFPKLDSEKKPTQFVNTFPDLQMTTIDMVREDDPYEHGILEPTIEVWENVTFADNYYQSASEPYSQELKAADLNIALGGLEEVQNRAGFTGDESENENINKDSHERATVWYEGTVGINQHDLGLVKEYPVHRRMGDFAEPEFTNTTYPWYVADDTKGDFEKNNYQNGQWEGNGTGYYYSILGNGYSDRPSSEVEKRLVSDDNTVDTRMQGDFAVPTLFNGNFDAIYEQNNTQPIPGWSFYNVDEVTAQSYLVDAKTLPTLTNYWNSLSSDTLPDYALELNPNESITHNNFVVPDWGVLRFNLHVPGLDTSAPILPGEIPLLKISATDSETGEVYELSSRVTVKGEFSNSPRNVERASGVEIVYRDAPKVAAYRSNRIAYGVEGFETFSLDVPDQLRGKSATLKFELESGSSTVYLDDVFFQTNNLLLGNPTEARIKFDYTLLPNENAIDDSNSIDQNNYLMEKPQYTIAYSGIDNTPIWASWQLNKTWLGSLDRESSFSEDLTLPYNWYQVKPSDYSTKDNLTELQIPGAINPADGSLFQLQRGHLVPAADRDRNRKDAYEVSLLSNIIPQHEKNNVSVWKGLEEFSRDIVEDRDRELYIIAGGYGTKPGKGVVKAYEEAQYINVPNYLWKVIVVLDQPGQGIADITEETKVIAVVSPNNEPSLAGGSDPNKYQSWYQGGMEIISVRELEDRLNSDAINQAREIHYNLLSNVPQEIQDIIETQPFTWIGDDPLNAFSILNANLLAEVDTNLAIPNTAIWHNGVTEESPFQIRSFQNSPSQVSFPQNTSSHISSTQVSASHISSIQASFLKFRSPQVSFGQVSTFEVSPAQYTFPEIGTSQIGTSQISTVQSSVTQVGSPQNGTLQKELFQPSTTQVSTSQIESVQVSSQFKSGEVSFPSSIPSCDFFSINPDHNWFTQSVYTINNSAIIIWDSLLKSQSAFDIKLSVKDLPNGQLAEAQITSFDASGMPNAGTIFIDDDANGKGWFIDSTPLDNSEFASSSAANYFQADVNSAAYGKYDLLTTLLHETAHLYGLIDGFWGFDDRISTKNGTRYFTGDNFTATLDGEHLDKQAHPYDLFNTNLAPGMRKLPSELDVQILEAIFATNNENQKQENAALNAPLTSTPLLAQILNGTFDQSNATNPSYGWSIRGDSAIINGQAILGESDRFNPNFSQSFTIPEGAKYLQFTLLDTQLGAGTKYDPSDAFEVALLDANTLAPLAGTATGLTSTDALLNIQQDGTAYLSPFVTLKGSTSNDILTLGSPMTFMVDVSNIAPGTEAKLYFDLLGFGDRTAQVTLDNVRLVSGNAIASEDYLFHSR